jgi:hypothetical protein
VFLRSPVVAGSGRGLLVEARSCRDAPAGGSHTSAAEERSPHTPWPSHRTPGDRVSDRGRLDDEHSERVHDARIGHAPRDDS